MNKWEHPEPIFLDFETQSQCDIKTYGGRKYAEHPSTRILILVWSYDGTYHVWIPEFIKTAISPTAPLWPYNLKPSQTVQLYRGQVPPVELFEQIKQRPIVAHNAYEFDQHIWNRFFPQSKGQWLDSLLLSRASGRPGSLDKLGSQLIGTGKDRAKKLLPLLTTAVISPLGGYSYPVIKPGDLQAFTTYAIADVEILKRVWRELEDVEVEADAIDSHCRINDTGIRVDPTLLNAIERVSEYATSQAALEISKLTGGTLHANNLRSVKQVHEWLDSYGVTITDDNGKPCLRKEIVQRFIDSPFIIEEHLSAAREIPPVVIDVLKLRLKALRITDAKVRKAQQRVSHGNRLYGLLAYYLAHTGRFGSLGVQFHNLPRPDGRLVDDAKGKQKSILERILSEVDFTEGDSANLFEQIKRYLPELQPGEKALTVDDVCSALIRPSVVAKPGHVLIPCDFSTVEVRGLAWIAEEQKMLDSFHQKKDIYKNFAASIYNKDESEVTKDERQVAKPAVLGAGYGIGPDKLRVYAANMGVDLVKAGITAEELVNRYRDTYTRIAGFKPDRVKNFRTNGIWHKLDKAVMECVATGETQVAGKCQFSFDGKHLKCRLPSGRLIWYPEAKIEDVIPGYCYTLKLPLVSKATVTYLSNRGRKGLYGGLLTENVVQAICRDLLVHCILVLQREGYNVVLHIHDEIVLEVLESQAKQALRRIVEVMSTVPAWAEGFPLDCEGFVSPRFTKSALLNWPKLESHQL